MTKARLLVVDDEQQLIDIYRRRLEKLSYTVFSAISGQDALKVLQDEEIDVLITDFRMPGMDGCEIITRGRLIQPLLQSIVITGYSDIKSAINAMGAGAFNYLQKPIDFAELDVAIKKGLEKRQLILDVHSKQRQLEKYRDHLEELVEKRTQDLTEANRKLQKEIEDRKSLEISLREAKMLAENASMAKSEFLANMSHEIRTPMTSTIGLLNLVLETDLLPKQKAYLEMARISSVVMHNLLNDILDFSKIEAGRLNLESIPFTPQKIIESVIHLQHLQAEEKSISLFSDIDEDVPRSVIGDPNRLRQILLNLVSNAIKFTQYGEISVECRVAAKTHNDPNHVLHFSVRDSGVGIDQEKISRIFEAFTQADNSTTREFGGVGLGLNICSKLVAMMGGSIWAESTLNKGSTFHFTCRFNTEHARGGKSQKHVAESSADVTGIPGPPSMLVLVVEDDHTNQLVIREILEKEGHTAIIASNGIEALKEVSGKHFDLVLLDLKMPEMTGYEVTLQLRHLERQRGQGKEENLPIMALTGFASEDEKQRCLAAGMDDFLAKPFSVEQLIKKTRKFAAEKKRRQSTFPDNSKFTLPDPSVLQKNIFNEDEALRKASGNREKMIKRVRIFLQKARLTLAMVHKTAPTNENALILEQEVQNLKNMAMEIGAVNLSDELFSILMQLRKKAYLGNDRILTDGLLTEFDILCKHPTIRALSVE